MTDTRQKPTTPAELRIPDDLKALYRETKYPADEDALWANRVRELIERIARLEGEG